MLQPNCVDLDIVLLEQFPHVRLTEPHGVVADVDLMRGPENQSTHTRDDYMRNIVAFEEDVTSSPKISFLCL